MEDIVQTSTKPLILAIPTNDEESRELKEDLRAMGCAGVLARPWNVQSEDTMREFLYERGNQRDETKRRDPGNSTTDTWAKVYGFDRGIKEGWAGQEDGMFAGKLKGEVDPKEGLHPANCLNLREQTMLESMMPIQNPEKPKRITLTMANTLFRALSGVRPVNWGLIIHEIVARAFPYIGRKAFYISPFIIHLYTFYRCTTIDGDDMLISAAEEIAYKSQPVAQNTSTSSNHPILEAPPSSPGSPRKVSGGLILHLLLLHVILLSLRTLPDPVGHSLRLRGKTWICPRGNFRTTPSNGCLLTWRISRPSTTGWSTSSEEQT